MATVTLERSDEAPVWNLPAGATVLQANRPWQSLYGVRLRRAAPASDAVSRLGSGVMPSANPLSVLTLTVVPCSIAQPPDRELSLIEKLLPNEMLLLVFARLPISSLGAAQCVCRQWRIVGAAPSLWRTACLDAFAHSPHTTNERLLRQFHRGCWKTMYLDRPHLRFDGVYVSRNTYLRTGVTEWKVRNPVHLVCYYRYYRFFPDGKLLYRTSPENLSRVVRSLQMPKNRSILAGSSSLKPGDSTAQLGRYKIDGNRIFTGMRYENNNSTEIRSRLKLRSTTRGANNRLDIELIVSYDTEDGRVVPMSSHVEDDVGEVDGTERRSYSRGLAPFVFVPWEGVHTHVINLPVNEMDVFIAG